MSQMRTIILCRGLPASGKSTWSKEQLKKYPGKYKRVNRDILRAMLDDSQFSNKNEVFITEMEKMITLHALAKGLDVIVDDTNLRASNFTEYCQIAKRVGNVRVMEKYFDVDLKTCIERNENREPNIPKEAIQRMYNRYLSKGRKIEIRDEYFPPVTKDFEKDETKKDAVIVDIDGTLAHNYNGRSPYDGSRVNEDVVDEHVKKLASTLRKEMEVIIVTGREDLGECKNLTLQWLNDNGIEYDGFYIRKNGDHRKDYIIKKEIYDEHIAPFYNVIFVVDDRKQVVDMWRSLGITCLHVDEGLF